MKSPEIATVKAHIYYILNRVRPIKIYINVLISVIVIIIVIKHLKMHSSKLIFFFPILGTIFL